LQKNYVHERDERDERGKNGDNRESEAILSSKPADRKRKASDEYHASHYDVCQSVVH
jgi:hypothetical protein